MKIDCITVIKILRCFRASGSSKWRNRFKNKEFVVLAKYFKKQTNCSRYRRKMSQSRRSPLWRNESYLPFFSKQMETIPRSHNGPPKLRTTLEEYFRFQWNCKQLWIEARNSVENCEIYFPIFSETIDTTLKIFSQHDLMKVRQRLL